MRYHDVVRECLAREESARSTTPWGAGAASSSRGSAARSPTPRRSSRTACALARAHGVPVKDVHAAAMKAWLDRAVIIVPPSADARQSASLRPVSRFYLTTAIDYVNGRPHLGHGLREDHGRRHRPLQAAVRRRDPFPDGQRRALAERLPRAREQGLDPLAYCDQMEQVFRDVWARLDISFDDFIRTTEPRHRVAVQAMAQPDCRGRRPLRGRTTRAGTASRARPSSRRRISSTALCRSTGRSRSGSGRRTTSSGCRRIAIGCWRISRRTRSSCSRSSAQRDPAAARGRARGHLGQPRRTAVGHSAARTIRRAWSTCGSTR